jgi:hypothetical protein
MLKFKLGCMRDAIRSHRFGRVPQGLRDWTVEGLACMSRWRRGVALCGTAERSDRAVVDALSKVASSVRGSPGGER